jgi:thiamine-phosphate pyrophosphorylase
LAGWRLGAESWCEALLDQIAGAIAGGVDVVQLREHYLDAGPHATLVRRSLDLAAGTAVKVIVNDRLDIALACGANGVHLRENSISIAVARRLAGTRFVVGQSVHVAAAAERVRIADYLIAGSVFTTESKPGALASLGLEGLRDVVAAARPCPVWAIGGASTSTARELAETGAAGMAAIGAFIPPRASSDIATEAEKVARKLRFCFDSAAELS